MTPGKREEDRSESLGRHPGESHEEPGEPHEKQPRKPLGRWGEALVRDELTERGFRLVAQNLRVAGVELDLIVRRGRRFFVVEVKTCRGPRLPEANLSAEQVHRLRRALGALPSAVRPRPSSVDLVLAAVSVPDEGPPAMRFFRVDEAMT